MGEFLLAFGKTEEEAKEKLPEEQRQAEKSGLHPEHRPITFPDWHNRPLAC